MTETEASCHTTPPMRVYPQKLIFLPLRSRPPSLISSHGGEVRGPFIVAISPLYRDKVLLFGLKIPGFLYNFCYTFALFIVTSSSLHDIHTGGRGNRRGRSRKGPGRELLLLSIPRGTPPRRGPGGDFGNGGPVAPTGLLYSVGVLSNAPPGGCTLLSAAKKSPFRFLKISPRRGKKIAF